MDINWDVLQTAQGAQQRSDRVREMLARCEPGDPVFLSDCIVKAATVAPPVMLELAEREDEDLKARQDPMLWKILVLKDEWGNQPNPGDVVVKVNKRPLKRGAKYISSTERNIAMMDGSYEDKFENRIEYVIDEKGCIECSFTDAVHFLHLWGVHLRSGRTMTTKNELSTEPHDAPGDRKLHVHYWRYMEQTKESYDALPLREHVKKWTRGIKPAPKKGKKDA